MALIIKTNGEQSHVLPKNGEKFSLEELQEFVHGYIEPVSFNDGRTMLVDEEGKLKDYEVNELATAYAHRFSNIGDDVIVGDVAILLDEEW